MACKYWANNAECGMGMSKPILGIGIVIAGENFVEIGSQIRSDLDADGECILYIYAHGAGGKGSHRGGRHGKEVYCSRREVDGRRL